MIRVERIGPVANRCVDCGREADGGGAVVTVASFQGVLCRRCVTELAASATLAAQRR